MIDLFPFQVDACEWIREKRFALLALEMGLGKSAISIKAADVAGHLRILVLCPAVARHNWLREFQKFSSNQRQFDLIFKRSHKIGTTNSVICSYDLASQFKPHDLGKFDLLILDEGHYLKSIKTKRTQAVFGKEGYVRHAKNIWVLSGTPAPNHAGELWPLLYTFGLVSEPYDRFLEHYCTYLDGPYGRQITGTRTDRIPELKAVLNRIMLRQRATDVLKDLPSLFFQDLLIDAEPDQIDLDFKHDERFWREKRILEDAIGHCDMTSDQAMAILEGLAGSIATLRRYVGLKKVNPVAELVKQELLDTAYNKIVLFAIHTQVVDSLMEKLKEFNPVSITGSVTHEKRQQNIDAFQNDPKTRVFIGNIQAAGTAITLTAANHGLFVEQDWVPGNNAQAAKRLHRIGQSKPVFIRVASLANSFDEQVSNILMRKARELSQLFDEKKSLQFFSELTNT